MANKVIEKAKVDEQGRIAGLEAHKGEDVYVVKAPRIEGKTLERPREVADELFRYVKQHRELAEKQYQDFTTRFGKPSERMRELASHLTPEEFSRRTKEIADYAEKRLSEVRKEAEAAYARVEKEIEARAESLLSKGRKDPAKNGATVTLDEHAAAGSVENRSEREF